MFGFQTPTAEERHAAQALALGCIPTAFSDLKAGDVMLNSTGARLTVTGTKVLTKPRIGGVDAKILIGATELDFVWAKTSSTYQVIPA